MGQFDDLIPVKSTQKQPLQSKQVSGGLFGDLIPGKNKKPDLTTAEGITQIAEQSGLGRQVQRLTKVGEQPKKIFSGGPISDIFDILQIGQFATAGATKALANKQPVLSGVQQGIRKRASFADPDLFGTSTAGKIFGIVADIVLDPTNILGVGLISKTGKVGKFVEGTGTVIKNIKSVTPGEVLVAGLKKGISQVADIPIVKQAITNPLGRSLVVRYGQDPIYRKLAETVQKNIQIGTEKAIELTRPISNLSRQDQQTIAQYRKTGELSKLPDKLRGLAKPAFDKLDELGKQAVETGLLNANTYQENVGKYIARLYTKHEVKNPVTGAVRTFFDRRPIRLDLSRFKKRLDIPEDVRQAMGEVLEAGYPTAKSLVQLNQAVERGRFFQNVSQVWGASNLNEAIKKSVGKLSEFTRFVSPRETKALKKTGQLPANLEGFTNIIKPQQAEKILSIGESKTALARFKPEVQKALESQTDIQAAVKGGINKGFIKSVTSPQDLAKGFERLPETKRLGQLSGQFVPRPIYDDIQEIIREPGRFEKLVRPVVAGFKYGKVILNPAVHARNILSNFILNDFEGLSPARLDIYARAASELAKKGTLYQEAKQVGLGLDTFAAREIKDMLTGELSARGKVIGFVQKTANKIASLYEKEEQWAKMSQYIYQRNKGLNPEEAFKIAERATFNYAQITPFIRSLRTNLFGFPFITFTYKATPQVIRTAISEPTKISKLGKIARGVESFSPSSELQQERAVEPEWLKNGFFVKLPGKDKYGRSKYFDMTYILPFGDLVSGHLFEGRVDRETGLPENLVIAFGRNSPAIDTMASIVKNQDFFGKPIYKQSDEPDRQAGDIFKFLIKQYSPPLATDLPQRFMQSSRFENQAGTELTPELTTLRETKTRAEELLRGLAGLKVQPFSLKKQRQAREREQVRRLQKLLEETNITKTFKRPFIPKAR